VWIFLSSSRLGGRDRETFDRRFSDDGPVSRFGNACSWFLTTRGRDGRLAVINSLTGAIARTQQHGPMMQSVLDEFKKVMNAKAAWFVRERPIRRLPSRTTLGFVGIFEGRQPHSPG